MNRLPNSDEPHDEEAGPEGEPLFRAAPEHEDDTRFEPSHAANAGDAAPEAAPGNPDTAAASDVAPGDPDPTIGPETKAGLDAAIPAAPEISGLGFDPEREPARGAAEPSAAAAGATTEAPAATWSETAEPEGLVAVPSDAESSIAWPFSDEEAATGEETGARDHAEQSASGADAAEVGTTASDATAQRRFAQYGFAPSTSAPADGGFGDGDAAHGGTTPAAPRDDIAPGGTAAVVGAPAFAPGGAPSPTDEFAGGGPRLWDASPGSDSGAHPFEGLSADRSTPPATPPMVATRPRVRSGAIVWGLIVIAAVVAVLVIATVPGAAGAFGAWQESLTPVAMVLMLIVGVGVLILLFAVLAAIRRAQRRARS